MVPPPNILRMFTTLWLSPIQQSPRVPTLFSAGTSTDSANSLSSETTVTVERVAACGDIDSDEEDDEMEQEEMFVDAYDSPSFDHGRVEWGGPRRGGRLPEPTRFGDWERKGRCSDF